MPTDDHISYECLSVDLGYSVAESSLQLFTLEENQFRSEVRVFAKKELASISDKIEFVAL